VGGACAIWMACVAPPGVQMSPSATTLEAMCCPLHNGMTRVNSGGVINRQ